MPAPNRPILSLLTCATVVLTTRAAESATAPPAPAWKPLFNGHDLSNWDVFVATPDGVGPLVPNVDPKRVFQVGKAEGGSVIHVSGEVYGAITTHEEFGNFHFRVDFTWGMKRWAPRATVGRDTGILYCGAGAPNPRTGHEVEIGDPKAEKPEARSGAIYPFHAPGTSNTKPPGQWNSYEIVCREHDYSVRINGKLINTWTDAANRARAGFIGLQNYNDQKVVRHRNVRIKQLP